MFESFLSHLGSLWGGALGVTFESLLGHFNSFWVSVELGARRLPKNMLFFCKYGGGGCQNIFTWGQQNMTYTLQIQRLQNGGFDEII